MSVDLKTQLSRFCFSLCLANCYNQKRLLDSKCSKKRLETGLRPGPQEGLQRSPDLQDEFKGKVAGNDRKGRTGERDKREENRGVITPYH